MDLGLSKYELLSLLASDKRAGSIYALDTSVADAQYGNCATLVSIRQGGREGMSELELTLASGGKFCSGLTIETIGAWYCIARLTGVECTDAKS